ncbi:MAG: ABC transporter ATP-binding protein [bacterium]|nr:ABC transporter ATP-binding protein [bacterium]
MAVNSYKQDEQSNTMKKTALFKRLFHYLLDYKLSLIIVCVVMGISTAISILNPLIMETAIDHYIKPKDFSGLLGLCLFAIGINIGLVILIKLRMYIMAKVSNKVLLTIRQELYTHIQTLSFDFFDSRPTGKILARIIGDVNSLKGVISDTVTTLLPDFITICAVVIIMVIKNYKLAFAALSSLPLMIFLIFLIQSFSHKCWQVVRKKNSNLNAFIHENLSGIRIIQSFHAEEESNNTFDELVEEHRKSWIKAVLYSNAFGPSTDFCWGIGTMMLYLFGIYVLGRDAVSLGTYVAFASYIGMFWNPVMNLSNYYNQLITNLSGAERIFEIIDTKPTISDSSKAKELPDIKGDISFDHVTFSYDSQTDVLHKLSFHVKPGETIALVGPTGAGKTTIVNLISRFYNLQHGDIKIDGHSINSISLESLRSQMGVMTQDSYIFTGTIRDNIRYGNLDATEDEIIAAAKAVHAHDFICKLPDGYDTELKERGGGLSVGQKQLLAFARTLLAKPKILILDEATSSIDTKTEKLIQQGIEALLENRTAFVIAHRLSTIQNADRIFVIDEGGIIEEGSAAKLLAKHGAYYRLYMAQA